MKYLFRALALIAAVAVALLARAWMGAFLGIVLGLVAGLVVLVAGLALRIFLALRNNRQTSRPAFDSLVVVRQIHVVPTELEVRQVLEKVLGAEELEMLGAEHIEGTPDQSKSFVFRKSERILSMHFTPGQYGELDENDLKYMGEKAVRVLGSGKAWFSCDDMNVEGKELTDEEPLEESDVFPILAKITAEFCDVGEPVAMICPTCRAWAEWDDTTIDHLRNGTPMKVFGEGPHHRWISLIIGSRGKEEALDKAMEEARERFPEFLAEWSKDSADRESFFIKAPFGDDDQGFEHMWVRVNAVDEEAVEGILINEPHDIEGWKEGQKVKVKVADLSDWMILTDDKQIGNFTEEILLSE